MNAAGVIGYAVAGARKMQASSLARLGPMANCGKVAEPVKSEARAHPDKANVRQGRLEKESQGGCLCRCRVCFSQNVELRAHRVTHGL